MDIKLDAETLRRIAASEDQNEIAQLCKAAGLANGSLTLDSVGNVVVNADRLLPPTPKPRIDFDDRNDVNGANPSPQDLEFRK